MTPPAAPPADTCARCGGPEATVCPRCGDPLCADHAPMPGTPCSACRGQRLSARGVILATCAFFALWLVLVRVMGPPTGLLAGLVAGAVTFIVTAAGRVLLRPARPRPAHTVPRSACLPTARALPNRDRGDQR